MNLLAVKNLYVRIEGKVIVENLSFDLGPSDRLSIVGPNGAGKTVLLKALLGLIPYSGEIVWDPTARIGYVPQKIDADRHLPLTYTDLFNSKCRILKVAADQIEDISPSVGLTKEMLATPVGHLSGGNFQRGLIGFALIGKPNVLLLDEPTASIDELGEEHIYELVHRLQEQYKLAVIIVSHINKVFLWDRRRKRSRLRFSRSSMDHHLVTTYMTMAINCPVRLVPLHLEGVHDFRN